MWIRELAIEHLDARNTTNEIIHQPILWQKIWKKIHAERVDIKAFFERIGTETDNVILTGAGTSAYIGIAVQHAFRKRYSRVAEPISTTHIVSHPQNFILPQKNLLMVSFARSGNSPESCAAVDLANQFAHQVNHFIITCNSEGKLAQNNIHKENTYVFVLPPEANDKSLAMTSSFTGMMLAAILVARIEEITFLQSEVDLLANYGNQALQNAQYLWDIAGLGFERAVFLGAGALYGVAKEAQLKMQELSDGLVICKYDSFLGLRHGPKAVINEKTLVVYHLSNNMHSSKYEMDLLYSMRKSSNPLGQLAICEGNGCDSHVDWGIVFDSDGKKIDEDLFSVVSVMPAQMLALFKSIQLGLMPDNPSRNGAIARVVQGVSIYHT